MDGHDIDGSPFHVVPKPAFDLTRSRVYGPAIESPVSGESSPFFVDIRDKDGNSIADLTFLKVFVDGKEITSDGHGKFLLLVPNGPFQIRVFVDGKDIHGSPFTIDPKQAIDVTMSSAFGPALESPLSGDPSHFFVQVKDKEGKPVTKQAEINVQVIEETTREVKEITLGPDGNWRVNISSIPKGK